MAICRIKQPEIFSSGIYDDTLDPSNAPTAANLEEDLNYIRSVLKSFFGGVAWYDIPTGDFSGVLNAFPVQHYTAADDPTKEGHHKDIIADSINVLGSGTISGNFSVGTEFSVTTSGTTSLTATSERISLTSTSTTTPFNIESSSSIDVYTPSYLRIFQPNSTTPSLYLYSQGNIIINKASSLANNVIELPEGYTIYADNAGPLGNTPGSRIWINGPDGIDPATNETGVVIGPRAGAAYFSYIRARSNAFRIESSSTYHIPLSITSWFDSSTSNLYFLYAKDANNGNGIALGTLGSYHNLIPIVSSVTKTNRAFSFLSSADRWVLLTLNYLEILSDNGSTRIGAGNASYSHFYTDRPAYYFNVPVYVDHGGIGFYDVSRTKSYRIYVGSTFPVTPQEGDIWFKV